MTIFLTIASHECVEKHCLCMHLIGTELQGRWGDMYPPDRYRVTGKMGRGYVSTLQVQGYRKDGGDSDI